MKEIAVLGCTGSIGTQTLDVIRLHKERFHAAVLAARKILICFAAGGRIQPALHRGD